MSDAAFGTTFAGQRGRIFRLSLGLSLLTILTLGLYRFWMKTRLRRYYWSSVKPGGLPLEYVGEPLEKVLGFLIAVVFIAFYIGIVNLVLMFGSFALFSGNAPAYFLSFLGVVPLVFFARYRARRYVLARTRWRGIRFGVREGAWGYAVRAIGHWMLTLLTLGLWWPRMTFALEKYRVDRTTFGDEVLHQGGHWSMLYPAFGHLLVGVVFSTLSILVAIADQNVQFLLLLIVFVPWGIYGLVHYMVEATRLLADRKSCGGLGLVAKPRPKRAFRIYLLGGTIVFIVLFLILMITGFLVAFLAGVTFTDAGGLDFDTVQDDVPGYLLTAIGLVAYFTIFLFFGVLRHSLITLPMWRHYAETLAITGTQTLPRIGQTKRDALDQAEGFAEALDVGAAI